MNRINIILFVIIAAVCAACGIYKFNDTSIAPDVHSISVYTIENRAMKVNPILSNTLTVALQDQYRKLTNLEMLEEGGDLEVSGNSYCGYITGGGSAEQAYCNSKDCVQEQQA